MHWMEMNKNSYWGVFLEACDGTGELTAELTDFKTYTLKERQGREKGERGGREQQRRGIGERSSI